VGLGAVGTFLALLSLTAIVAAVLDPLKPPVWPFEWNATLAKINPNNNHIQWTKFYYDYKNRVSRFDFYDDYFNTEDQWGTLNCSILFTADKDIWFVFPDIQACALDHKGIPTISPWWLSNATYNETTMFRGMWCHHWDLPTDLGVIEYWARADTIYTPVRSTNQANDPGATDYLDVVLGPQDPSLFVLPSYCSNVITTRTCG